MLPQNNADCRCSNASFYVMLTKISPFGKPFASFDVDRSTRGACGLEVIIKYSRRRTRRRQGTGGRRKRFQTAGGDGEIDLEAAAVWLHGSR
jgi:hypothetical protein